MHKTNQMESSADNQQYLFIDMGHDTLKIGNYYKKIEKEFDYFLIPT